jgi:hypothetical protein
MTTPPFTTSSQASLLALCMGAASFLLTPPSDGQALQSSAAYGSQPGNGQQTSATVDPQRLTCNDLKSQLKSAGELSILSGPRGGWGDTFYGPAVPRCQFWQMPQFAYVRTRDGLCGVGYICVDKYSID